MTTSVSGPFIAWGGNIFHLEMVRHSDSHTHESVTGFFFSVFPGTCHSLFIPNNCTLLSACSRCLVSGGSKESPLNNWSTTAVKKAFSDAPESVFGSYC